jgi:hypothetical protein
MRNVRMFGFLALTAAAAACAGGGGTLVPQGSGPSGASLSRPAVSLRIVIPNATQTAIARRRAYVSASIASLVYQLTQSGSSSSLVAGADYTNVAASPGPCVAGAAGLTCTIGIGAMLTSGTYTLTLASYDAAQSASCVPGGTACAGHLLGLASLPVSIVTGSSTPVAVTLGGVPAAIKPLALTDYAGGAGDFGNGIVIFGPQPQIGTVELLDADGNVIVDPGAPTVAASSGAPGALTVAVASPSASGVYSITFSPVLAGRYVQPGAYPASLSISAPNLTQPFSFTITVHVAHSGTFVSRCDTGPVGEVLGFLDGNTTASSPDMTIPSLACAATGLAPQLATDRYGDLYVAAGGSVAAYAPAPGTNPSPYASSGPAQGLSAVTAVAADHGGFLYVGDQSIGLVVFTYATPGPGATFGTPVADLPYTSFLGYRPMALAADPSGNLYVALIGDGAGAIDNLPTASNGGGLTSATNPTQLQSFSVGPFWLNGGSLAADVQPSSGAAPDYWYGDQNNASAGQLAEFGPLGASPLLTIASGLGTAPVGVAIDNAGVVSASAINGTLAEFLTLSPPGYAVGTPHVLASPVPSSLAIAVAPAAAEIGGSGSGNGGSPAPLSSGSPTAIIRRP